MDKLATGEWGGISIASDGFFDANSTAKFLFLNVDTFKTYKTDSTTAYESHMKYYSDTMTDEEIEALTDKTDKKVQKSIKRYAEKYKPAKDNPAIAILPPGTYRLMGIEGVSYYYKGRPHAPQKLRTSLIEPWFEPIQVKAGEILHLGAIRVTTPIESDYRNQSKEDYNIRQTLIRNIVLPIAEIRDDRADAAQFYARKYPKIIDRIKYEPANLRLDIEAFKARWTAAKIDYNNAAIADVKKLYGSIIRDLKSNP